MTNNTDPVRTELLAIAREMKMRSLDGATRSALSYSDDLRVYADRLRVLSSAPPSAPVGAPPEDRFEQFVQAEIARSPDALRELGNYLADVLDEDRFPRANRLLLQLATEYAPPSTPVGAMADDARVPDDYRNQASGYRAGWNDALACRPNATVSKTFCEQMEMLRDDFARYSDGDPKVPFVVVREALVAVLNEWDAIAEQQQQQQQQQQQGDKA